MLIGHERVHAKVTEAELGMQRSRQDADYTGCSPQLHSSA